MAGIFESISNLISSIFQTILAVFQSIFSVFETLISSVVDLATGTFNFVFQNIIAVGLLVAALVAYSAYMQRQGKTATGQQRDVLTGKKRA